MKKISRFIQMGVWIALLGMIQPLTTLANELPTETSPTTGTPASSESAVETPTSTKEQAIQQVFHVQKIISSEKIDNQGLPLAETTGVNGAQFKVYDISDLLKKEVGTQQGGVTKEKLKTLMTSLAERAGRLSMDQLKAVSAGETKTENGKAGVYSFTVNVPETTAEVFYVVNTTAPKTATISKPFVVITPVCDKAGVPLKDIWLYPKSEPVTPTKEVKKIVSTGVEPTWWEALMHNATAFWCSVVNRG